MRKVLRNYKGFVFAAFSARIERHAASSMPKSNVPVSVHKATLIEQRSRALHLRRGGLTFEEIGADLGCDEKRARRLCSDAMEDARAQVATAAKELRAMEVSRLDSLLNSIWDSAMRGNLLAIDRVVKLMERRAKMLGLDSVERMEDMTAEEIALEAQRVIQQAMATSGAER